MKFNNKTFKEMGIVVVEEDFTTKASQNVLEVSVTGRNGNEFIPLNYKNVSKKIDLQLVDKTKEDDVYAWLNGEGILELNNRITTAYFYNEIPFERNVIIKNASFNFIRSPFWYKKEVNFTEVVGGKITNEGSIYSEPLIRLEKQGTSTVDLTVNDVRFSYNFKTDSYVEINCETGEVLYDGNARYGNIEIGYKFPTLKVGENTITIHSGSAKVKMKKKDRWL